MRRLWRCLHTTTDFAERKAAYTARLRECANAGSIGAAARLHEELTACGLHRDIFLSNLLVFMYGRCGDPGRAKAVFDSMARRNVVSWTVLIGAFAQAGHNSEALAFFHQMDVPPSNVTFVTMLGVCSSLGSAALQEGKAMHARITEFEDSAITSSLLNMYAKCGSLEDAIQVFHGAAKRDVISWTTLVAAYAQFGHFGKALEAFNRMASVNEVTFITVLGACSNVHSLFQGREIHCRVGELGGKDATNSVMVGTALVNMYGKCGSIQEARAVFDRMPRRDVIAWNAILAAYAQNGDGRGALVMFRNMDCEGVKPDNVSYLSALDGCSSMGNEGLMQGRLIHSRILETSSNTITVQLENTLVNMYGKCGSLLEARQVFEGMGSVRDAVSWAALVGVYAHHGHWQEARQVFRDMELQGMEPHHTVFVSILGSCSHAGLLGEARFYFLTMVEDHGIRPTTEHYACMLDGFGRVGRLEESQELISNMPYEPCGLQWRCFLGACSTHFDNTRGAGAAELASKLEPHHGAAYVMLSSIYRGGHSPS